MENYYDIMGLDWKASKKEIEAAYQSKITSLSKNETGKITILEEAYHTLVDLNKRRAYDVDYYLNFIKNGKSAAITKVKGEEKSKVATNPLSNSREPLPRTSVKANGYNNGKIDKKNKTVAVAPLPKTKKPLKKANVNKKPHLTTPPSYYNTTQKKKKSFVWIWFLPVFLLIGILGWMLSKKASNDQPIAIKTEEKKPLAYNNNSTILEKTTNDNDGIVGANGNQAMEDVSEEVDETVVEIKEEEVLPSKETPTSSSSQAVAETTSTKEVILEEETPYRKLSELNIPTSKEVRVSKERRPPNGAKPYLTFFDTQEPLEGAKNQLKVHNRDGKDAVVILVNTETNKIFSHAYIRNNKGYTFKEIPTGVYYLQAYFGSNWNPTKQLKHTNFQGGFDRLETFQRYDSKGQLYKMIQDTLGSEVHYAQYESTLGTERRKEEAYDHLLTPHSFFKID